MIDRPVHQPLAYEAPIPGTHWYSGCDPDRPRVGPGGVCVECGGHACPECGRETCGEHDHRATLECRSCGRVEFLDHPTGDQFFCCGAKMTKTIVAS